MTSQKNNEKRIRYHQKNKLILHLTELKIQENETQIIAKAELEYIIDNADEIQAQKTEPYQFFLPNPIQLDELQWYLTQFSIWPSDKHLKKAKDIEKQLMAWGSNLFKHVFPTMCDDILNSWYQSKAKQYLFSVHLDDSIFEDHSGHVLNLVLSQPWHLMYDGYEYIFSFKTRPVRVRYLYPSSSESDIRVNEQPVRVLLISPRPEDDHKLTDTDHRFLAKPLLQATNALGNNISVHILKPPTFLELEQTLDAAREAGKPFHVVHFDGHWDDHPESRVAGFCFEDPELLPDTQKRKVSFIDAHQLAKCMQSFEIPFVFLGTCQHPLNNFSHIVTEMLYKEVSSVIVLPYKLMPETTTQFFKYFYQSLIQGDRVTQAMLAAQMAIKSRPIIKEVFHGRPVYIQDWFVPTLFQRHDPRLFHQIDSAVFESGEEEALLNVSDPPAKTFVNRSQEFLYIERLLENDRWAVIQANSGEGKTALALEIARWLMKTSSTEQVLYVKLIYSSTVSSIIRKIGDQILTNTAIENVEWKDYLDTVLTKICSKQTILVVDNAEYFCPRYIDCMTISDLKVLFDIYSFFIKLMNIPVIKIIFNTCQTIEEPFDTEANVFHLKPLDRNAAIELIHASMKEGGYHLKHAPEGRPEGDIEKLIKAVHYHPKCLICLAPILHRRGLKLTIRKMTTLMNKLSRIYPDPRECALAASFELTIQKFSETAREYVDYLAFFHECANEMIFTQMIGELSSILKDLFQTLQTSDLDELDEESDEQDDDESSDMSWLTEDSEEELEEFFDDEDLFIALQTDLIKHNLAWKHYDQLAIDPAFLAHLNKRLTQEQFTDIQRKWAQSMEAFIHFIDMRFSKDPSYSIQKTILTLPNIMAFLSYCISSKSPDDFLEIIDLLYPIMEEIDYEHILKQLDLIRGKLFEYIDKKNDD